jgi:cytochrome oxidase Cu insertion factor (SCO1/SenC/PrrC family)
MKINVLALFALLLSGLSCASEQSASTQQPPAKSARTSPVGIGGTASDFTLEDQHGRKVTLSAARGEAPVVLVFYRGYW